MIEDLKTAFEALSKPPVHRNKFLIFSRSMWETDLMRKSGYDFTKEELDAADKLEVKLIGTKMGVDCYIQTLFIDG